MEAQHTLHAQAVAALNTETQGRCFTQAGTVLCRPRYDQEGAWCSVRGALAGGFAGLMAARVGSRATGLTSVPLLCTGLAGAPRNGSCTMTGLPEALRGG